MRLWLHIQIHSTDSKAEILALLKKPEFDALQRLSDGHVSVFKGIMDLLEKNEAWDEVYRISQQVFEKGIEFMAKRKEDEASKEKTKKSSDQKFAEAKKESEARAFCSAVMDWSLWNQFISSASHHKEDKK